jgi:hypothetical protein
MKKTLQDQYLLIKEGKGHTGVFLTEAKRQFPNLIPNDANVELTSRILKDKNIINENIVGMQVVGNMLPTKKESYEVAFENFLKEAKKKEATDKAEVKTPSKSVKDEQAKAYDNTDDKNIDNLIFDQVMKGYYAEMKDPKNNDKTSEELKAIVLKNLSKDPIHYTKDGQFGVKGLGYVTEHPGLGTPKEAKGPHKASGYGNLNESKQTQDMSLNESKLRSIIRSIIMEEMSKKPVNENIQKRLKEIDGEVANEVTQSKLNKIEEEIAKRTRQLEMIDENEDLKQLTDTKKVRALQKEIKLLEKSKLKLERTLGKGKSKEVIDEVEEEPTEEYLAAKQDAEDRYNEGEDAESILSDYPQFPKLHDDIIGKFEGSDY